MSGGRCGAAPRPRTGAMTHVADEASMPAEVRRDAGSGTAPTDPGGAGSLPELVRDLAHASRGLRFIYRCLDALVARHGLRDAVVVVDLPDGGRQAFRAGRRPLDGEWAEAVALHGECGTH